MAATTPCLASANPGLYFDGTVGSFQTMRGSMSLIGFDSRLPPSHTGLDLCSTVGTRQLGRSVLFLWGGSMPLLGFDSCLAPSYTGLDLCGTVGTHQLGRRSRVFGWHVVSVQCVGSTWFRLGRANVTGEQSLP